MSYNIVRYTRQMYNATTLLILNIAIITSMNIIMPDASSGLSHLTGCK